MTEQKNGLTTFTEESSSYSLYSPFIIMHCKKYFPFDSNKTTVPNGQQFLPNYIQQSLAKQNITLKEPKTVLECAAEITRLANITSEINSTIRPSGKKYDIQEYSHSLIIFVILIGFVSLISIIGNLCLAKVLYSKRYRLIQTDRIVLCLALSKKRKFYKINLSSFFYIFR